MRNEQSRLCVVRRTSSWPGTTIVDAMVEKDETILSFYLREGYWIFPNSGCWVVHCWMAFQKTCFTCGEIVFFLGGSISCKRCLTRYWRAPRECINLHNVLVIVKETALKSTEYSKNLTKLNLFQQSTSPFLGWYWRFMISRNKKKWCSQSVRRRCRLYGMAVTKCKIGAYNLVEGTLVRSC